MTRYDIQHAFADRIKEVYMMDSDNAQKNARRVLRHVPEQLLPNIHEWIRGVPLSDIYIRNYSVPMIMKIQNSKDFLGAVRIMAGMEENPGKAVRQIWNMRR